MLTIVIDDAIVEAKTLFQSLGKTIIVPGREITQYAAQADALIIRSRTHITAEFLAQYPQIRFIGSSIVGLDHIDLNACTQAGVHFYSAQGCNARSVAEYVITQVVAYAYQQHRPLNSLAMAIIGVGHVGKQVQQLAQVLGIHCYLNDPYRQENEPDFNHTSLDICLQQADIITLHTPLTHQDQYPTYHLINATNLTHIKPNALFINAARGDIVDETALCTRADLKLIIDCWHNEPHINATLLALSQLATPHIAGHAWDAKYRGGYLAACALADWSGQAQPTYQPMPTHIHLQPPQNTHALTQLHALLQQAYDYQNDDQHLRHANEITRAHIFEDYRRHYPIRREWTELTVHIQTLTKELHTIIPLLGFKISVNDNISH